MDYDLILALAFLLVGAYGVVTAKSKAEHRVQQRQATPFAWLPPRTVKGQQRLVFVGGISAIFVGIIGVIVSMTPRPIQ